VGGFGACEVLSFHATKAFNTMEGGAIVTNDDTLAEKMRLMRNFGFAGYDNVVHPGTNGKMIEVCAAMGLANLDGFDAIVSSNRRNHAAYEAALAGIQGVSLLSYGSENRNSHHYIVCEIDSRCGASRDAIVEALHAENVLARKYFWPGSHRMQPYRELFPHAGLMLQNTEQVSERLIVLPNGSAVDDEVIAVICDVIATLAGKEHP
jgi:dTDP-4-amino-4,6-dideoxygalactose transaminase